MAVRNGYVPEDPAAWTIADVDGWTIAHEMARCHLLPNDFDLWYLKDRNGRSIADVMREVGDEPPFFDSSPSMRL